jgi:signal transduction histidine kinase
MLPNDLPASQPFFASKQRAFWQLQAAGWAGAAALRIASNFAASSAWSTVVFVLLSTVVGYSLSLILSVVYRQVIYRRPVVMWGTTIAAFAVAAATYSLIDTWVFTAIRPGSESPYLSLLLANLYIEAILLAAWSALYFAINYYVRAEEQKDQMLYLAAQAAKAQLAMLRYQLNPHFLFNTLNSISTLVLLKDTDAANAMLSRLSAFLRSTLTEDSGGMVTLAREIETLKLYLDIEKMRFQERMRTYYTIDPATRDALVPSLLLQPLVENAVKYAVSPLEEGADISVSAQLVGKRVRIVVADTGPGLAGKAPKDTVSTGVGMANIRDRLAQAYGDDHRFETASRPSGGFEVLIEIPHETAEEGKPADRIGGLNRTTASTPAVAPATTGKGMIEA